MLFLKLQQNVSRERNPKVDLSNGIVVGDTDSL
jgi:hypothetical protein